MNAAPALLEQRLISHNTHRYEANANDEGAHVKSPYLEKAAFPPGV